MKKIGLDDYLKNHSIRQLLALPRVTLASKCFFGLEGWHLEWRTRKYDAAAIIDISTAESKMITAKELVESEDEKIDWIWHGFIGLGMISMLSARPKCGKTTLLFELLKGVIKDKSFLGYQTHAHGKILLLTEEPKSLLRRRFQRLGLAVDDIIVTPKFHLANWKEVVAFTKMAVEKSGVRFIIIDTIAAFWSVKNENDASDVREALNPIQDVIRKNNAALLLIHHLRKAEGEDGTAIRGSGQLFAMVEAGMELNKISHGGNRRQVTSQGRYEESQQDFVIEFSEEGYRNIGSIVELKFDEVKKRILDALPEAGENPITEEEIRTKLADPKPSKTSTKDALAELTVEEKIKRAGAGVKGDPYKYKKKAPQFFKAKTKSAAARSL